ncbi:unnamed protein product (macronuclear) [Paramecium tetraurelia]|uniref:CNNM transmembrane domain-containing protein n=1 Tax=Paramecium tetraurelia TaxID=5888 RepID=A0BCC6_PARTE|nr:uncharacterized protein GSPATT00004287001 [Paramecium tetraurelia]CAK56193.1 unnamed protein product [Paramecium tetraurelia]|eukprot:XP_001423591.1 hypothetical protein (macronuclear) [Paramecium tetraurelia strain d4-2]
MFDKNKFLISSISITLLIFVVFHNVENLIQSRRFLQEDETINNQTEQQHQEEHRSARRTYTPMEIDFWICLLIAATLICMAAICSGMTVGYLSVDELQLEIYKEQGTHEQQRQANVILPIIKQHHMLLCTLLIGNAFCMESLPIFFDKVVPPAFAVLISVIFIIFAGEIIPQALCTGPKQLIIAEKLTPIVKILMILFWPISYPLAKLLDSYFGEHGSTRFQKNELKALIELHGIQKHATGGDHANEDQGFTQAEINMITSTIDLRDKTVGQVMVLIKDVFSVNKNNELNKETLARIASSGYSYVTIYENQKENIIGTIRSKQLIDMELTKRKISELENLVKPVLFISGDTSLFEMLMIFKQKKTKIAFVVETNKNDQANTSRSPNCQIIEDKSQKNVIGLISLKMLFEEIVKKEFHDQDNHIKFNSLKPTQIQPIGKLQNKMLIEPEEKQ